MPVRVSSDFWESPSYCSLRTLLINYRFKPGEQLHPAHIADCLRMSSTPIREMLHRMSAEHLLTTVPGRGFFARTLTEREMRELLELIHLVFTHAISTCPLTTADPLLAETLRPTGSALPWRGATLADAVESVLQKVAQLSGNQTVCHSLRNWLDRTHYVRSLDAEDDAHGEEMIARLHEFLGCLRANDQKGALKKLSAQLRATLPRLSGLVREGIIRCHEQSLDQTLSDLERKGRFKCAGAAPSAPGPVVNAFRSA
jgi:DNA-binding GntR family transcriptional regulator